ncbi:MAG TPA: CBS domain-containing protein [Nocardioidaceae bacterium]|nr:CBS domain-containing protein [Nocardioidaceae bacterium]
MDLTGHAAIHPAVGTAGDIMSSPPITVPLGATRTQIADRLTQHRISAVPVVDESGTVVGLVSEHDLLSKEGGGATELMTTAVISVSVDSPLEDVRHLLVDRRIRRVPVLRDGRLVGVVSRGDVVATMATEWVCGVCGESVRGETRPQSCPKCQGGPERFVHQEQPPGA